jgi:DNA-binding SARP family transcriptional activator/TolB-like protein
MLQASLVGGFRLTTLDGRDLTPRARKAAAIVGYLLLSGGPTARRERIASLLWSEKGETQARDSLRQCLAELRRATLADEHADACVDITAREVALRRGAVATDVDAIRGCLERGDPAAAARLLDRGDLDLLAGFDDLDPAFADWLVVERERWSQGLVAELLRHLRAAATGHAELLALAQAVLRLDPYQEDAVRATMEGLATQASPSAALGFFARYRDSLRREYEVEPSDALAAFAGSLGTGVARAARRTAAAIPAGLPRPSPRIATHRPHRFPPRIAVRIAPHPDPDLAQLGDAFRHDLIATLSRFKDWTVIPAPEPGGAVGHALDFLAEHGVGYALRGGLAATPDGPCVELALLDSETGRGLLDERFPIGHGRWIAVLNEICCQVGAHLHLAISSARLRYGPMQSADARCAYDLWLEGHQQTSLWRKESEDRAQALFERAIALDPNLACAYSSLAGILHTRHIVCPGWPRVREDRELALKLARRSVELDRMDSRNHVILAWAHILARRYDSAEFHFQLAVDLNPSNPNTVISAASGAMFSGAHDQATRLAARAFELNPLPPDWYYAYRAQIAFITRDLHGCVEDVARAHDVLPSIRMWAAAAFAQLGEPDLARAELEACHAEVRRCWAGPVEPDEPTRYRYLQGLYGFRREEDHTFLATSLEAAAKGHVVGPGAPTCSS